MHGVTTRFVLQPEHATTIFDGDGASVIVHELEDRGEETRPGEPGLAGSAGGGGGPPPAPSPHPPAEAGKPPWSPGSRGISPPTCPHQSSPGPTASTMPCWGGDSCSPGGSTRPERRTRSGSSSLMTTWSKRGRSCCLIDYQDRPTSGLYDWTDGRSGSPAGPTHSASSARSQAR